MYLISILIAKQERGGGSHENENWFYQPKQHHHYVTDQKYTRKLKGPYNDLECA